MRIGNLGKIADRGWHKRFVIRPVFCRDIRRTVFLETVWAKAWIIGASTPWLAWEYRATGPGDY